MDEFERRARSAFDASVESLDAATCSRLNQARQKALAAAGSRHRSQSRQRAWYATWAPAGALATAVVAVALLLRSPTDGPAAPTATNVPATRAEPLEMLAADEDFAIATSDEDLEFYAWVDLATTTPGQTG